MIFNSYILLIMLTVNFTAVTVVTLTDSVTFVIHVMSAVCKITACHRTFSGEKRYLSVHVYICMEIMSG